MASLTDGLYKNITLTTSGMIKTLESDHLMTSDQVLTQYIDRVNSIPMLSLEDEMRLTEDYFKNKTASSANTVVLAHLRLVVKIARKFSGYNLPLMDLICEGNYGLVKAMTKFDPTKGFRFVTYAIWWIKSAIQEYVMKSWSMVKIGTSSLHRKKFFNQSSKKIDGAAYDNLLHKDVIFSSDNEELSGNNDFEEQFDKSSKCNAIINALQSLTDRERKILYMREISEDKNTLDEISKIFNISKERVRQIYDAAIKKVRLQLVI